MYPYWTLPKRYPANYEASLELHTEDHLEYQFYPVTSNILNFKIKAPNDAHIALTTTPYKSHPIYEVFFGGWENTKSVIRKNEMKPDVVEVTTPHILDRNNHKGFWIRWDYGVLSAGVEGDYTPILRYEDPTPFQIQYFGVCTGWGARGHWIIQMNASSQGIPHPQGGYVPGAPPQGGYIPGAPPQGGYIPGAPPQGGYIPGAPPQGGYVPGGTAPIGFTQPGGYGPASSLSYPSFPNQTQDYPGGAPPYVGFNSPTNAPRWIQSSHGSVPPNAVVGGNDINGESMYIARAHHEGALLPGKLVPSHGVAYVAWGGRENPKPDYEVLCDCSARWVPSGGGQCPPNALVAGRTESGETLYVGRAFQDGSTTVGKVQPSHGVCYIPFGGNEVAHKQYEILIA